MLFFSSLVPSLFNLPKRQHIFTQSLRSANAFCMFVTLREHVLSLQLSRVPLKLKEQIDDVMTLFKSIQAIASNIQAIISELLWIKNSSVLRWTPEDQSGQLCVWTYCKCPLAVAYQPERQLSVESLPPWTGKWWLPLVSYRLKMKGIEHANAHKGLVIKFMLHILII